MRRQSAKFRKRANEARGFRKELLDKYKKDGCWICGKSPHKPHRDKPLACSVLCVHEILNGPLRQKCLDAEHSVLVLCSYCNQEAVTNKGIWPEARQLKLLLKKNPDGYDLKKHNYMARPNAPNRITQQEVDYYDY